MVLEDLFYLTKKVLVVDANRTPVSVGVGWGEIEVGASYQLPGR